MKFISHPARLALLVTGILVAAGTGAAQSGPAGLFRLKSPVIRNNGGSLPTEYTCDGESASPPFTWNDPPPGTHSFAMTLHHIPPDDEVKHVYIVLYNIPADVRSLAKNSKDVGVWGMNSMRHKVGYTPPCSGGGGLKIYTATLYALSSPPNLEFKGTAPGMVTMDQLLDAIDGKVLARSSLDMVYMRGSAAPNNGRGANGRGGDTAGGRSNATGRGTAGAASSQQ